MEVHAIRICDSNGCHRSGPNHVLTVIAPVFSSRALIDACQMP